jgi:NAD(P)-dependent dehydrogenase (short-subunit alcohol dehydrogenase family)
MMSKTILITGGARGIGAATAKLLAQAGYAVCINYRNKHEVAEKLVSEIHALGGIAKCVAGDISNEADVRSIFDFLESNFDGLHGLVNNAGILSTYSNLAGMSFDRLHQIFAVNVIGAMMCAKEATRLMSTKNGGQGGSIVNLSTAFVKSGAPDMAIDYASSKGAVEVFTLGLSKELASHGIRVNAVRPGMIDTEIHADGGDPNRADKAKNFVPMKRVGEAIEVAQAISWLISDKATYCSGSILEVSGGV